MFVASLNSFSPFHDLFSGLLKGKFKAAVTTDIVFEYLEVFQDKFSRPKLALFYNLIAECPYLINVDVYFKWSLIVVDPDYNKFVDCAIAAMLITSLPMTNISTSSKKSAFPMLNV